MLTIKGTINNVGELRTTKTGKRVRDIKLKSSGGYLVFSLWDREAEAFPNLKEDTDVEVTFNLYSVKNKYDFYEYKVTDVKFLIEDNQTYRNEVPESTPNMVEKEDFPDDLPFTLILPIIGAGLTAFMF
jgi:hypothetical protein